MENSYEFSLYGRCDDQVNGPSGYEYLYWSVPQITSVGSDLNDFVYNSVVYLQPNFQVLYPVMSVIDRGTTYFYYPHVYYSNDCVPNTFTYQDLSEGLAYCVGYNAQAGYVNDSWSEGLAYYDGYSDPAGYVNDSWSEGLAYCDGYSDPAGYIKNSWSEGLVYWDGYSDQAGIYGAVDKGPCYGHFLDEIVAPEITSCYISYTEIPEKLNDAPVNSDGEVYEREGETHSSNGNGDKEGGGDTSVSSRFKSTLKSDSDLKESDLKEYYFNDTDWLRIPKPEIRYEDESEKRILYVLLASLNMSILKQYMEENYDKKKKKRYRRACKGNRKQKKKLKELKWRRHRLGSIREVEEPEADSVEMEGDEMLQNDLQIVENDVVSDKDLGGESRKMDEDPQMVKVGDIYVRYAPDRYRVFCLENSRKKRFGSVRKFFGRIFSYVKKPT